MSLKYTLLPALLGLFIVAPCHAAGEPDPYTGPVTPVGGEIGSTGITYFQFGAYPTPGSIWKYKTDFTQASLATFITQYGGTWKNEAFDDAAWPSGASEIGYGDATRDEVTLVPRTDYSTASGVQSGPVGLFRSQFSISNLAELSSVSGMVRFDDSCAIYVNGVEVYRHADLTPAAPLTEYTEVTTATTRENLVVPFTIPLARLRQGVNTVAVEVHQHDPGSGDLSFDLSLTGATSSSSVVQWTEVSSPYHITQDVVIPAGKTLIIGPGVRVFAEPGRTIRVDGGIIKVLGTAAGKVAFSHRPGATPVENPREPGVLAPPKWGGILITDSLSSENQIRHATFYGAQPAAIEGSITVVRSQCYISDSTFCATYLHGVYGKNCSLTVDRCIFPDVFPPGKEALGQVLDNLSEFVEVDSSATDPAVVGNPLFYKGFPIGGHLRIYRNHFYGSSGHNDLIDITAGKWGDTPVLDVQDNHFHGPTGDEHIDLNGDAYIAGNIFENCTKDAYTSDNGYANAISSDEGAAETTIVVTRNLFVACDHAVNVKRRAAVIFEHNTVADVNPDYLFQRGAFSQQVQGSAINFFIPEDAGVPGDGAYVGYNIFYRQKGGLALPRVLSHADKAVAPATKTTKLDMAYNFIDPNVQDPSIGTQHPQDVLHATWLPTLGNPEFTGSYGLSPTSPARASAPHGLDFGSTVPAGCYFGTLPPSITTQNSASITIGGPGMFAYRWRLNAAAWSAPVAIAPGVFPRTGATQRTAVLALSNLSLGTQNLEVIGQDFAGNWQTQPTSYTWIISSGNPRYYQEWLTWHSTQNGLDTDADGLDAWMEFSLGTDPNFPNSTSILSNSINGHHELSFTLPEDPALSQSHGRPEIRYQIESSSDLTTASWLPIAIKTPDAAWTGPVTLTPDAPGKIKVSLNLESQQNTHNRRFYRLRALMN